MTVFSVMSGANVPPKTRIYAILNFVSIVYVIVITLSTTYVTLFHVVLESYKGKYDVIVTHRILISYVITMVTAHYITCIVKASGDKLKVNAKFNMADDHTLSYSITSLFKRVRITEGISRKESNCEAQEQMEQCGYCPSCKEIVPARTHHCFLCEKCVLKRDHHCFFMGSCIGKNNHQSFVFFTLFMSIATLYGFLLISHHFHLYFEVPFHGPHTVFTFFFETLISILYNKTRSTYFLVLFIQMYSCLGATLFSFWFLLRQLYNISKGQTPFEAKYGITKYSKGSCKKNYGDVFNGDWLLRMAVPGFDLLVFI